jgi:DNA (cytosine-5)-methyltransferase 1
MDFVSLFAGIGGFDAGLTRAGMTCVANVEKDQTCRSVLARHFPGVPQFDDVREFHAGSIAVRPGLICGGFPCQDLSVAGKRAGLAGKRSGLLHEFMRIVGEYAPAVVLIENVPGLLSSNGGRDMGVVVGRLADLGYGWAYRVLDAQWFALAQRRKRVFVVGCLGNVRRAAEILFERESLPWNPPPSREARTRVAAGLTSGSATDRKSVV